MISCIEVWQRGQAIPLHLFEMSDTNSPDKRTLFTSIRHGSNGFPSATDFAYPNPERLSAKVRAVQLQQVEGVEDCLGLVPAVAKQLEGGHPLLVATDNCAVDQAGAHFKVVHSLDRQRIANCPSVVAVASDQADAHGVAPGHEPEAIVLDLVNPAGPGGRPVGWGRQSGSMMRARSADRRLRISSIDMPLI
jgi:hypothetical protein